MAAKNLFSEFREILAKNLISCFAKFSWNFAKFCGKKKNYNNNFVKVLCFLKFVQCCFAATLCRSGGGGWGRCWRLAPCAPSELTQIVPISASIYTVFHSVIFNSVMRYNEMKITFKLSKIQTQEGQMSEI